MSKNLDLITVKDHGRKTTDYSLLKGQPLLYAASYIKYLERIPTSQLNRDEQLAYWLNLHNVGMLRLLAVNKKGYKKIEQYRGTPGSPGKQWSDKIFRVEAQDLSLEDIEQNILFRQWQDPLIIYGLSYGAQGSPAIGKVAFFGAKVKAQLEAKARKFINSSKNVKISKKGVQVSSLYTWNKASLFSNDDHAVIAHIKTYAKSKLAKKFATVEGLAEHHFNWQSNALTQVKTNRNWGVGYSGGGGAGGS